MLPARSMVLASAATLSASRFCLVGVSAASSSVDVRFVGSITRHVRLFRSRSRRSVYGARDEQATATHAKITTTSSTNTNIEVQPSGRREPNGRALGAPVRLLRHAKRESRDRASRRSTSNPPRPTLRTAKQENRSLRTSRQAGTKRRSPNRLPPSDRTLPSTVIPSHLSVLFRPRLDGAYSRACLNPRRQLLVTPENH